MLTVILKLVVDCSVLVGESLHQQLTVPECLLEVLQPLVVRGVRGGGHVRALASIQAGLSAENPPEQIAINSCRIGTVCMPAKDLVVRN